MYIYSLFDLDKEMKTGTTLFLLRTFSENVSDRVTRPQSQFAFARAGLLSEDRPVHRVHIQFMFISTITVVYFLSIYTQVQRRVDVLPRLAHDPVVVHG